MIRYDRALQCVGKVRYPDRRAARRGRRQSSASIGHLRVYRCAWCDGFHLGHVRAHALRDDELLELAEVDPLAAAAVRLADLGIIDVEELDHG